MSMPIDFETDYEFWENVNCTNCTVRVKFILVCTLVQLYQLVRTACLVIFGWIIRAKRYPQLLAFIVYALSEPKFSSA